VNPTEKSPQDTEVLRASGALLAAQIALGTVIERDAVSESPYDATTLDLLVRLHLAGSERLRAAELCDQLLLSPSHISRILDRAAADGLVNRQPDPDDRRAHQLVLTAKGQKAVGQFMPHLTKVLNHVIHDSLTPDEVEVLVDLLDRVAEAARDQPL
jgi:DNA-binding MarR family transcriptional regulator